MKIIKWWFEKVISL